MPLKTGVELGWWKPPDVEFRLSDHLGAIEFVCRHCGRAPSLATAKATAEWFERVRAALGGHPLHISSGARCPFHNRAVGGKTASQHLLGNALDLSWRQSSPYRLWQKVKKLQRVGLIGGVGRYHSFVHIDRGPTRSWDGP